MQGPLQQRSASLEVRWMRGFAGLVVCCQGEAYNSAV